MKLDGRIKADTSRLTDDYLRMLFLYIPVTVIKIKCYKYSHCVLSSDQSKLVCLEATIKSDVPQGVEMTRLSRDLTKGAIN